MNINIKKAVLLICAALLLAQGFSFGWPQDNVTQESFNSYFGQKRGSIISTSVVFSEPEEVKASETGYVLAILTENNDDSDFFPSTLGTAVILSHEDNLLSVYGNLDSETLTLYNTSEKLVDGGATIGQSGTSGFQEGKSNLEFQVVDTKNKSAINPKVLMPRSESELPLAMNGIMLLNKNNNFFDISVNKTFNSGLYKIYFRRNPVAAPYKTSVSINGVIVDQLSYDMITQENNKLCIIGKKKYTSTDVFPNNELQLIGEAMLTPGRATLGLSLTDSLGNVKQLNYNIIIK